MPKSTKDKLIKRFDQLLEKGEKVKTTHKPNSSIAIGFPTLDEDAFFEWKSGAENMIAKTAGDNSTYYEIFKAQVQKGYKSHVDSGIGVLRALKEDLELGFLAQIRDLVFAEVFTDFLDIADHLLANGYKDPAASLIGAVLEDGLRKIAAKNGRPVKNSDDIGSLNTKLADAEIYSRLAQKQIQAWKAVRDSADHAKFDEYRADDVRAMMDGVSRFLAENLG